MKVGRELAVPGAMCALVWLTYTCGGGEGATAVPNSPGAATAQTEIPETPPPLATRSSEPDADPTELAPFLAPGAGQQDAPQPGDPPTAKRSLLEEMLRARAMPRHSSDGGGKAWLEAESTKAEAGRPGSWTITFEAGPEGIAVGGFVRLTPPPSWGWSAPQFAEQEAPGFTTLECAADGVTLELRDNQGALDGLVRGRALAAGERVRIVYGAGPAGALADRYAEHDSRFWITVDGDGDGYGRLIADSPAVDVAPGPAAMLSAILPSTAEPGDTLLLRLAFLDATGSRGAAFSGDVTLVSAPEGLVVPEKVSFAPEDAGVKQVELQATKRGVFRLLATASDTGGDFFVHANPLLVDANVAPIRWADFHGHSNLSDGTGTPEEYLSYARDVAGLDAIALTDHDHWGMQPLDEFPELWAHIRAAIEGANEPGRFVTVLGFEWTNWIHGHKHVLYFGSADSDCQVLSSIDERYRTPAQLWDALHGTQALTFAHHPAGGVMATNWDFAPDPELEPVVEVASVHGASEASDAPERIYSPVAGNFVRDALARGYVLGFVGSGDSHDGHPGLAHLVNPQMGGLAALLTRDLTRAGIRTALKERRSYATNGPRIVLRAALDGQRMGSIVAPKAGKTLCYVRAIGTAPIGALELVRAGKVVESLEGEDHWDVEAAFEPEDLKAGEYLYVRVVQTDGGAAWSSPFFVR